MKTILVLISANVEWREVKRYYPNLVCQNTPYGEYFILEINQHQIVFFQGGWGKIAAAASTQYALTMFTPELVFNLGTCGGFSGRIKRDEVILAQRTLVYDIVEQMLDASEAICFYAVEHDLSRLKEPFPIPVQKEVLVSADRDIIPEDIAGLIQKYDAVAADWESGAIAWVCKRNQVPCFFLRGVSDLVDENGGEAYGDGLQIFEQGTARIMKRLLDSFPEWVNNVLRI